MTFQLLCPSAVAALARSLPPSPGRQKRMMPPPLLIVAFLFCMGFISLSSKFTLATEGGEGVLSNGRDNNILDYELNELKAAK